MYNAETKGAFGGQEPRPNGGGKSSAVSAPSLSLPKGGGSVRGMGEKFSANPVTGTGSMSVPVYLSPSRSGFSPQLSLSYDSGSGNGVFGLGWHLSLPSIARKTDKGIPRYIDSGDDADTFILSDAEDLVPSLRLSGGEWLADEDSRDGYDIKRYRPRIEGMFARIERWTDTATKYSHWRVISKDNVTSVYGLCENSRISDPRGGANNRRIFKWLLSMSFDSLGNAIYYGYKPEDLSGIPNKCFERNRSAPANRYIKRVLYGNRIPFHPHGSVPSIDPEALGFMFEAVFDYGERGDEPWPCRPDPFSSYRSGFELRTYRLCRRILMLHSFPDESGVGAGCLVRSTDISYAEIDPGSSSYSLVSSIRQTGYKRNPSGGYDEKSLPAAEFGYSKPRLGSRVCMVDPNELGGARFSRSVSSAEWADLYGEGLTGILFREQNGWHYKRNASPLKTGKGSVSPSFERSMPVKLAPSLASGKPLQIMDLSGDGRPDIVSLGPPASGFYEIGEDEGIENFRSLRNVPNIDWNDPNLRFVDLTGDGHADILITEGGVFTWHRSEKEKGFGKANRVNVASGEDDGPRVLFADYTQSVFLADMSGDGLSDIVRIRNGSVCYWPNLGYGRFGRKIAMANVPRFDHPDIFDPKRILLTDIDGTGTADIIYLGGNGCHVYFNNSGNSLGSGQRIGGFPLVNQASYFGAVDLLCDGTACLVWSSPLPSDSRSPLKYIRLMENGKPHLLTNASNGMGAETVARYATSTKFYLRDKRSRKPWATKLPFPVHVVEEVETIDRVGHCRLVTKYSYRHGYFDGREREFRGFGMVETVDAETFEAGESGSEINVPPVVTRSWYHTGAPRHDSAISKQYEREYWQGDSAAFSLSDSALPEGLLPGERREALRALKGSLLRTEVYEQGNDTPYQVTESNFRAVRIQPKSGACGAVFLIRESETLASHYEQDARDPRVAHNLILDVDDFGNVTRSASIVYPRRSVNGVYPEQKKSYVKAQISEFINETEQFYLIGVCCQTKIFEINGLKISANEKLPFEDVVRGINSALANKIEYHEAFSVGEEKESRLISWNRNLFWNPTQSAAFDYGRITEQALLHHEEVAVFTPELIGEVFASDVTDADLINTAKYELHDGYWWNPGMIQSYQNGDFYLPIKIEDPFGGFFTICYDSYNFAQISITDALENTVIANIDYRTLQPCKLTDSNGNHNETVTDPLGMVIAVSNYGTENGIEKGDKSLFGTNDGYSEIVGQSIENIVASPETYLQNATSFFYYDLDAWKDRAQPPQFISLDRETHVSDLAQGASSRIHISLGYSDGFGRELQSKIKVDPGIAWVKHNDNTFAEQNVADRWLVSGRIVYNNKGKPVKQYEPFYSGTYCYEQEQFFAAYGVTSIINYDPFLRIVKTYTPKGFFSKIEFTSWETRVYDENDTVKDSDYYKKLSALPADEREALKKAEAHYNTPSINILDTLGRPFITKEFSSNDGQGTAITYTEFDIAGNPLTIADPRQYEVNAGVKNFRHTYAMDGSMLRTISIDAGENRVLANILGNPVITFDAIGHKITNEYDVLGRLVIVRVSGNGLDNVTERLIYGELQSGCEEHNLRGKLYKHYDQAGSVTIASYSFKGEPLRSEQRIRSEYKLESNWEQGIDWDTLLEAETFITETEYDALGQVKEQCSADGSVTKPEYHFSGKLNKMLVKPKGEITFTEFVSGIKYNPKGQREHIIYGNATRTDYTYERETFRLTGLKTTRTSDNSELQDIAYTYDPVGNIICISDSSHERVFHAGQVVDPENKFVYDALYRLTEAQGREHLALNNPLVSNYGEFKQGVFVDLNDGQRLANYTQNYTYDKAGNLVQIRHKSTDNSTRNFTKNMAVAPNSNRAMPDSMGIDTADFFDANGNMTALEHLVSIDWNYRNNISKATVISRPSSTDDAEYYIYNNLGVRVRKVKETLVAGNIEIEEKIYLGDVEIKRIRIGTSVSLERSDLHVMDDKARIAIVNQWIADVNFRETNSSSDLGANKIRYQYSNHLGSASLELDNNGQIISYEEYFPYGGTSFATGQNQKEVKIKEYRYTGKERDEATGLYYHGARYYAPWLGRWLSCDPAGTVDELNLYVYVKNNPVRLLDPDGKCEKGFQYNLQKTEQTAKSLYDGKNLTELSSEQIREATSKAGLNDKQANSILGHVGEEKAKKYFKDAGYKVLDGSKNVNTPGPDFIAIDKKGNVTFVDNKEAFTKKGSKGADAYRNYDKFKEWEKQATKMIEDSDIDKTIKDKALDNVKNGKYAKVVSTSGDNITHLTPTGKKGNVSGLTMFGRGLSVLRGGVNIFSGITSPIFIFGLNKLAQQLESGSLKLSDEYQEKVNTLLGRDKNALTKFTESFEFGLGMMGSIYSFRTIEEVIDFLIEEIDARYPDRRYMLTNLESQTRHHQNFS